MLDMGMSLEMSEDHPWIAQFQVRPNLLEEIKAAQDEDPSLMKLKEEALAGHTTEFRICDGGLKQDDELCVPDVTDLRQRILQESHYTPYKVHPSATKMYHDVKRMY